jgi:hypothetical protein
MKVVFLQEQEQGGGVSRKRSWLFETPTTDQEMSPSTRHVVKEGKETRNRGRNNAGREREKGGRGYRDAKPEPSQPLPSLLTTPPRSFPSPSPPPPPLSPSPPPLPPPSLTPLGSLCPYALPFLHLSMVPVPTCAPFLPPSLPLPPTHPHPRDVWNDNTGYVCEGWGD